MSRCAVATLSMDGLFFARGILVGMRADKTLDALVELMCVVWSVSPVREAVSSPNPRAGSNWSFRLWSDSETLPI